MYILIQEPLIFCFDFFFFFFFFFGFSISNTLLTSPVFIASQKSNMLPTELSSANEKQLHKAVVNCILHVNNLRLLIKICWTEVSTLIIEKGE